MRSTTIFFDHIAQTILTEQANALPDLSRIRILIPNFYVVQPLAQALQRVAQRPTLLLPQMLTLNEWAQSILLDDVVITDSQRSSILYQQLRRQQWFDNSDVWSMTQELLVLFEELTYSLTALPLDANSFANALEQVHQSQQNSTLQLEARLVFELWHAMQCGTELDTGRNYQKRLAILAMQANQPLYVLRTSDWNALESRFLDEYARHEVVEVFDLREMNVLWGSLLRDSSVGLREQDIPPLVNRLQYFAASSLEQEARAATMQVRLWIQEGKNRIAIVVQDRLVARRMRALLERAEILIADETGWTFATLSVCTVLDRWLAALQSNFYHLDFIDLVKSPYIFAEMSVSERKLAVNQLEQILRKQNVVSGLDKYFTITDHEVELRQLILRLRKAADLLEQNKKKTLEGWLTALLQSLHVLSIDIGLQQDDAGQQLLQALKNWQHELATDEGRYRFTEWRRWLSQQLDTLTYIDNSIDSQVRFTHLAATRWRAFDGVILLGCDADHLPSVANDGRWFNDAVRSSLNLSTRSTSAARQRDDLLSLLALNESVLVTWQKDRNGEAGLLSSYLQLLRDLHEIKYGDDLTESELQGYLDKEESSWTLLPQGTQPAPKLMEGVVPSYVSISAYNSLVACPYQFYARHILHLNEVDEVKEIIEKRDYGERVHSILQRFHERHPQVSGQPLGELEVVLRQISEDEFADLLEQDFAARAWLARWYKSLPAYLEWQTENEAEGWRYAKAECKFDQDLDIFRLRGRVDRLDVRQGEYCIFDYKTQSVQDLRYKLRDPGEDVQLSCYAWVHNATKAAFVSIEKGKVILVEPKQDLPLLAKLNIDRLVNVMKRIREGTGLPANGINQVCNNCEMRGICRKGEWT